MQKAIRYTIFKTKWGYFGLAGMEGGVLRSCLPMAKREDVKCRLLQGLGEVRFDKELFKELQGEISLYFEGGYVNFNKDIPVVLDGVGPFARRV